MKTEVLPNNRVKVSKECPLCLAYNSIEVDKDKFDRWRAGEFAQYVWPDMTPSEREVLITGTHLKCWDQLFGIDDE